MPQNHNKNWIAVLASLIVGVAVYWLISAWLQNTVFRVIVTGNFPVDSKVIVSSVDQAGGLQWQSEFLIDSNLNNSPEISGTPIINKPVEKLIIDFIRSEGESDNQNANKIAIHNIQVPMPYSIDRFYGVRQITPHFHSKQTIPNSSASFEYDENRRIRLESSNPISLAAPILNIGIALLFAIAIGLIVKNSQWSAIPAFSDMSLGNRISSTAEFDTINGIRGLAAILVLLSHAAPGFKTNQMGLALLFIISGFLLAKPFILDNGKIYNWTNIERYLTKRIKRILPMYYLFVFITYVVSYQFDTALRHFLFIQAEGHLWPMTQIFTFYMLLPFVLLITCFLHKINKYLPILLLGLATYLWHKLASDWMPYFNGEFSHQFFLQTFLMGMLISYVYYDLIRNSQSLIAAKHRLGMLAALVALIATTIIIAWSAPIKPPALIAPYMNQFFVKSILAACIVLLALYASHTWFSKIIGNWLFRSIGVVGFSFYLLHALGMQLTEKINAHWFHYEALSGRSWPFTISAFCITYLLAVMAYSYVERPFFGYREHRQQD